MRIVRENFLSGRAVVWAGMAAIVVCGWLYMVRMNADMTAMPARATPAAATLRTFGALFVMWVAMMMAMMLPSIVPTVSVFAGLARRRRAATASLTTATFVAGYAVAWIAYCGPAAVAQWGLIKTGLLSAMGESASALLSAAILLVAGLYQFSRLKKACIDKCRVPLAFFMHTWRDGVAGAFAVGLRYGSSCVRCCWALMAVLFVVGTMNLLWMSLFTLLVLTEKIAPARWRLEWFFGGGFIAWGAALATAGIM